MSLVKVFKTGFRVSVKPDFKTIMRGRKKCMQVFSNVLTYVSQHPVKISSCFDKSLLTCSKLYFIIWILKRCLFLGTSVGLSLLLARVRWGPLWSRRKRWLSSWWTGDLNIYSLFLLPFARLLLHLCSFKLYFISTCIKIYDLDCVIKYTLPLIDKVYLCCKWFIVIKSTDLHNHTYGLWEVTISKDGFICEYKSSLNRQCVIYP